MNDDNPAAADSVDATLREASQALARTLATIARSRQLLAVSEVVLEEARAVLATQAEVGAEPADSPDCLDTSG